MRKYFSLACMCMGALYAETPGEQYRANEQKASTVQVCVEELASHLQVGGNYTYVNMRPHGASSSFKGNLGGMQASYEYKVSNDLYAGVKVNWTQGITHGHADTKRFLVYADAQERIGYTVGFNQSYDWTMSFFTGLGYRHLGHKLTQPGSEPLKFRYNEIYVPVGFLSDAAVSSWFSFGVNFTWMPQVYPTVKIIPLKGARWVITDTCGNVMVEVPFTFYLTKTKSCALIVKPFYQYWQDGHSTAKTALGTPLGLPGNTYNFAGAELNFEYSF